MTNGLTDVQRSALERSSISAICNALMARGLKNAWLRGLAPVAWHNRRNMVGWAYTLRFIPAREDIDSMDSYAQTDNLHRRAVEECPPGAVLVISTGGELEAASAGDLMILRLLVRGCAGIVTDGGFRDTPDIARIELPAYQRAPAPPASPMRLHPAELDVPIGCGGVAIYPGDIIVGDAAGVVAIPKNLAAEIADAVSDTFEYEEYAAAEISKGRSIFEVFPATAQSRAEFEQWSKKKG